MDFIKVDSSLSLCLCSHGFIGNAPKCGPFNTDFLHVCHSELMQITVCVKLRQTFSWQDPRRREGFANYGSMRDSP